MGSTAEFANNLVGGMRSAYGAAAAYLKQEKGKRLRIHREGFPTLLGIGVLLAVANLLLQKSRLRWLSWLISLGIWGFFARFFRDPPRHTPDLPDCVFSPADGTIVDISLCDESEYFNQKRIRISVYMSALNVHLNRTPLTGIVTYRKYHPGQYLVAFHPKASELNERCTIVFADAQSREVMVRQIAGLLARRIVTYLQPGQVVRAGDELGFIKFGSRCDVFLPADAQPLVTLNQQVRGGETVIARL